MRTQTDNITDYRDMTTRETVGRVTLNNASDYWTNGLYRTPNHNPSSLIR